jgi:antirestriction protein ArdC
MSKVYQIVQEKIVKEIEEAIKNHGTTPWRKPWNGGVPKNFITKKPYRGINRLLLSGGSYLTFKQIQDLQKKNKDIKLKKGSKSEIVVFWKFTEKEVENERGEKEVESYPIFRYYNVFHVGDVIGLEDDTEKFNNNQIENAEKVVESYKQEIEIEIKASDEAYYVPALDKIVAPTIKQYKQVEEFYSTLFHEMIHSTGHKNRLNRFKGNESFGSENYSKEELVAEIGSNMILGELGIENPKQHENSIAYLYGWLKAIKEDVMLITMAAQNAQKAADYIISKANIKIEQQEENQIA